MSALRPIGPHYGSNQVVTIGAGDDEILTIAKDDEQVRVWNSGSNKLYLCTYDSAGTARVASATDFVVPAGVLSTITKPLSHDRISLFSAAGSSAEVMTGSGW